MAAPADRREAFSRPLYEAFVKLIDGALAVDGRLAPNVCAPFGGRYESVEALDSSASAALRTVAGAPGAVADLRA